MGQTSQGAELICMAGVSLTTILLGGVTSASILTFGPILNRIGAARNIHPYRRANLLDGTANSLPAIIPFMSVFVFYWIRLDRIIPGGGGRRLLVWICPVRRVFGFCPYRMGPETGKLSVP